ncbi:metalloregulator ArsR/SmtB family transcription factor [Blastopirellula sp. JC732]|uniref:Metalloregulator ArsR/SmtB family transcription factor n=1 Tax=Blastopirellula sediminis TaxID=2894196 RepID=A0A9X1SHI1_9BACT|nr:metalloregulator ArsR/SmtB family transcription factor [Blastopirellula sediminis]MCC9606540.1 metalloregulator ArsR/SmtB family transcription factor [Blastopirellula sediminis]MCC9630162.1 metalloregulator ArsR/SmtB family transcription factor [Blastopirellula sediminis]
MKTIPQTLNPELAFRALSDPTRLRILHLLRKGELCVCDLVNVLDVPQPTASRHLAYLKKSGLVAARKEGLWQYYRLIPPVSKFHKSLLKCVADSVELSPQLQADQDYLSSCGQGDCCG